MLQDFKNDFEKEYPYIYYQDYINDSEILEFLELNIDRPYKVLLNQFNDFVISQGKCEVQE